MIQLRMRDPNNQFIKSPLNVYRLEYLAAGDIENRPPVVKCMRIAAMYSKSVLDALEPTSKNFIGWLDDLYISPRAVLGIYKEGVYTEEDSR